MSQSQLDRKPSFMRCWEDSPPMAIESKAHSIFSVKYSHKANNTKSVNEIRDGTIQRIQNRLDKQHQPKQAYASTQSSRLLKPVN